jgi:hypothetical protein
MVFSNFSRMFLSSNNTALFCKFLHEQNIIKIRLQAFFRQIVQSTYIHNNKQTKRLPHTETYKNFHSLADGINARMLSQRSANAWWWIFPHLPAKFPQARLIQLAKSMGFCRNERTKFAGAKTTYNVHIVHINWGWCLVGPHDLVKTNGRVGDMPASPRVAIQNTAARCAGQDPSSAEAWPRACRPDPPRPPTALP